MTPEMQKRLKSGAKAATVGVDKRNQAILEAHRDGVPLRAIAEQVGMSWSGVRKIIKEKGATP